MNYKNIKQTIIRLIDNSCVAAAIYGSQTILFDPSKDLDIIIVTNDSGIDIFRLISDLQNELNILIHPLLVNIDEYDRNPMFKNILSNGDRIV